MRILVIPVLLLLIVPSCSKVLDTEPYNIISEEVVWSSKANVESFIFSTYNAIMPKIIGGGEVSDTRTTNSISGNNMPNDNVYTEMINRNTDMGFNNWADVRRCNQIITKVAASPTLTEQEKKELIAEGKFLRAVSYYNVARNIGRIVWIDEVLTPDDDLLLPSTKNPSESYSYIIQDLKDAVEGMPPTSAPGRANKYVAAAILSEVALSAIAYENYPAAPGINQDHINTAIDYAKMVIDEGGYSLEEDYGAMFNEVNPTSNETILALYRDKINTTVQNTPIQYMVLNLGNGAIERNQGSPLWQGVAPFRAWWRFGPTHNLAAEYLVIDKDDPSKALPWDQTSQYLNAVDESVAIPESQIPAAAGETSVQRGAIRPGSTETIWTLTNENRDARWKSSFITDSSQFYGQTFTTCIRGNSNRWMRIYSFTTYCSITNLYWRKGVYNDLKPFILFSNPTDYHYVITRLGRVYLNLAEAYLLKGDLPNALNAMNMTRTVHGALPPSTAPTIAEAWTDYKRERRVDLTIENDYYWSLLRWGRYGGDANHGKVSGETIPELTESPRVMDVSKDRTNFSVVEGSFFGVNGIRNFDFTRRYLFPVPQQYIDRNPAFGPQNPGW